MLRRLVLTAAASATALTALPATGHATVAEPAPGGDHLTITISHSGHATDGTFRLDCHPSGGDHPAPDAACGVLDDTPIQESGDGGMCSMIYGGPATARITGTWAGRPVDAHYDRGDGCRIRRWDALFPVLPDLAARSPGRRSG